MFTRHSLCIASFLLTACAHRTYSNAADWVQQNHAVATLRSQLRYSFDTERVTRLASAHDWDKQPHNLINHLLDSTDPELRTVGIGFACVSQDRRQYIARIKELASDPNPNVRIAAIHTLPELDPRLSIAFAQKIVLAHDDIAAVALIKSLRKYAHVDTLDEIVTIAYWGGTPAVKAAVLDECSSVCSRAVAIAVIIDGLSSSNAALIEISSDAAEECELRVFAADAAGRCAIEGDPIHQVLHRVLLKSVAKHGASDSTDFRFLLRVAVAYSKCSADSSLSIAFVRNELKHRDEHANGFLFSAVADIGNAASDLEGLVIGRAQAASEAGDCRLALNAIDRFEVKTDRWRAFCMDCLKNHRSVRVRIHAAQSMQRVDLLTVHADLVMQFLLQCEGEDHEWKVFRDDIEKGVASIIASSNAVEKHLRALLAAYDDAPRRRREITGIALRVPERKILWNVVNSMKATERDAVERALVEALRQATVNSE